MDFGSIKWENFARKNCKWCYGKGYIVKVYREGGREKRKMKICRCIEKKLRRRKV